MFKSLQKRLSLLFMAFALLVFISVGATFWGLEAQRQDALVINMAGRQRMLIEQTARLALESNSEEVAKAREYSEGAEDIFDQSLNAMRDGGRVAYLSDSEAVLPGTKNPEILSAIDKLNLDWNQFRVFLNASTDSSQEPVSQNFQDFESISKQVSALEAQADLVVLLFQEESVAKVNLVRTIQLGFLACALVLLLAGVWVTRQSLLRPLNELKLTAAQLGDGDLRTPVQVQGPEEILSLSHYFDLMRVSLLSSQEELVKLNDTLEKRVALRTMELEALDKISREITAHLDVNQVLNSVTEKARQLLRADVATLCLMDSERRWLEPQVLNGPDDAIVGDRVPAHAEFAANILQGDKARMCANENCSHACHILEKSYQTSHLAVPLRVGGKVIGAFCVGSPLPNHFSSESAESLTKLANTAAIAMENARLYSQVERVATLEERNRIAADLHDGIGQTLSYLGLMTDNIVDFITDGQNVKATEQLQKTRRTINQAAQDIRLAINQLLDHSSSGQKLPICLEKAIRNFSSQHHLPVEWRNQLAKGTICSNAVAEQVIKIVIEALTNVKRHANATQVYVELKKENGQVLIIVEDDGQGFLVPAVEQNGHFGIQITRTRAAYIDGIISIESEPSVGTKVVLSLSETIMG